MSRPTHACPPPPLVVALIALIVPLVDCAGEPVASSADPTKPGASTEQDGEEVTVASQALHCHSACMAECCDRTELPPGRCPGYCSGFCTVQCSCRPSCANKWCGEDDGCGNPCSSGACAGGLTCGGAGVPNECPPFPVVTDLAATTGTFCETRWGITGNRACNPPIPALPDPQAWWTSLDAQARASSYAGFQLWSNTNATCGDVRLDAYSSLFSFGLAPIAALSHPGVPITSRISRATLTFLVIGEPYTAPGSEPFHCLANTGGAGPLTLLPASWPVATELSWSEAGAWIPPSGQLLGYLAGMRVPDVLGRVTTVPTSWLGRTMVHVEVTDFVIAALSRGEATIGFKLGGKMELNQAPAFDAQVVCRTPVIPLRLSVHSH